MSLTEPTPTSPKQEFLPRILPPEEKVALLHQWKERVEAEISDYAAKKDKIMVVYKRQKEMYDRSLGVKIKEMNKYDVKINARKKVLTEILGEIKIAGNDKAGTV